MSNILLLQVDQSQVSIICSSFWSECKLQFVFLLLPNRSWVSKELRILECQFWQDD